VVERNIRPVEHDPTVRSVGAGGWPNLVVQLELDASIMDGVTLETGAVGVPQGYLYPISIARQVMERLPHVFLVGEGAARFAAEIGAEQGETLTEEAPLLLGLMHSWDIRRRADALTLLREINTRIYTSFEYVQEATSVDSTIDHALGIGQGVCQDFTHIMLALGRQVGIPCRYVSGYLFHRVKDRDRPDHNRLDPDRAAEDAMHAWVEAWLPGLGWVGFDPTNNTIAAERHIRVAVGRDYADVPPTRGVFKGDGDSELSVAVQVYPAGIEPPPQLIRVQSWSSGPVEDWDWALAQSAQQQQ